jgi:hypothetical protein
MEVVRLWGVVKPSCWEYGGDELLMVGQVIGVVNLGVVRLWGGQVVGLVRYGGGPTKGFYMFLNIKCTHTNPFHVELFLWSHFVDTTSLS